MAVSEEDFDQLKDYVNIELPRRPVLLRPIHVGDYDDNPNSSVEVALVNAPDSTMYQQSDGTLWQVVSGTWVKRFVAGGGSQSGWIRITDASVDSPDTITSKVWQDDPNNTVLQQFTTSGETVTLSLECSYPLVQVNGTPFTLEKTATDIYSGDVEATIPSGGGDLSVVAITGDNEFGSVDTSVSVLVAPPNITLCRFTGSYPGSQTELKEGDNFSLEVGADRNFDQVVVSDYEAGQSEVIAVATGVTATVAITIADRGDSATPRPARIQVRDAVTGALSDALDTNDGGGSTDGVHVVTCNNLHPTVNIGTITYPMSQSALKGSETATVANTLSDYDTILYESPNGDLTIGSPTVAANPKTVQRIAGDFNNSTINFRITANRAANDADTVEGAIVVIANTAPVLTVTTADARLRSGGNNGTSAQDHTITVTSDQPLASIDMDPDSGGDRGAWTDSFAGGPTVWTRTLRVDETVPDEKGTFTWESISAIGLAGVEQTSISVGATYELGGFVSRDLTFAAFATTTSLGTEVNDFSKLTATLFSATNQTPSKQSIGTSPPVTDGYTIDAVDTNPTSLIWLDTTAASTNSSGTAYIEGVEETV